MRDPGTITLSTESVAVEIRAAEGARLSLLRCQESGTEFLTQPRPTRGSVAPGMHANFRDGPCAGIEDCLPTVGACDAETVGGAAPDHGDLWQLPWTVLDTTDDMSVTLEAHCFSRPLRVRKRISVQGRTVCLDYEAVNTGTATTSFLFALHPLLAIAASDRIVLPQHLSTLRCTHLRAPLTHQPDRIVAWPATPLNPQQPDLSVTGSASDGFAAMLYTGRLQHGLCGLFRSQHRQGILLRFDPRTLPYLGIWLCYGGWPETADQPPQYAVALEPTTAPCNTLDEAQHTNSAMQLQPNQRTAWQIRIELTAPNHSYESFLHLAGLAP